MGEITEAEALPEPMRTRIRQWFELQQFISTCLGLGVEDWLERYIGPASANFLDPEYLEDVLAELPDHFSEGPAGVFERGGETALLLGRKRSDWVQADRLSRLSSALGAQLREAISSGAELLELRLLPADFLTLAKFFSETQRPKNPRDHRQVRLHLHQDRVELRLPSGDVLLSLDREAFRTTLLEVS